MIRSGISLICPCVCPRGPSVDTFSPAASAHGRLYLGGNFLKVLEADGSCAKNDLECASPGLLAYQCQWKVLHCEGRAGAAFTCGGVRERTTDSPPTRNPQERENKTLRGTMTMAANITWCFVCGLRSNTRANGDFKIEANTARPCLSSVR